MWTCVCIIGNFTKVKLLKKPKFKCCWDNKNHRMLSIVFPEDIVMKLYPVPICKSLNKIQSENFNAKYDPKKPNKIYNYAFENFTQYKTKGGCVLIPQCMQLNCNHYACNKHKYLNEKIQPQQFKMHHNCGFDKINKIALLSCEQMVVYQFMKTQGNFEMKLKSNEELIMEDALSQMDMDDLVQNDETLQSVDETTSERRASI